MQRSVRYLAALLCRHRCTVTPILYSVYARERQASADRHALVLTNRGRTCECRVPVSRRDVLQRSADVVAYQSRTLVVR